MTEFFVLAQGAPAPKTAAAAPAANTTATTAQANGEKTAPPQSGLGGLMGMLPMILIIAAMFYLMWRGQSKERKKREAMIASIKGGDRVVTIGGIFGTVAEVRNDGFTIKISDNVKVEVTKGAVASVVPSGEVAAK